MNKKIVSWFALMVFAGALSACGQQNQGGEQATGAAGDAGQQQAPAGGTEPTTPSAPAGQ